MEQTSDDEYQILDDDQTQIIVFPILYDLVEIAKVQREDVDTAIKYKPNEYSSMNLVMFPQWVPEGV